jgi:hypothetical protein
MKTIIRVRVEKKKIKTSEQIDILLLQISYSRGKPLGNAYQWWRAVAVPQ